MMLDRSHVSISTTSTLTALLKAALFSSALLLHSTVYSEELPKRCQQAVDSNNSEEIIKRCFSAADDGNPEAAFRIGEAYDFSKLSPENADKALYWYNKAAQVGHPLAQRNLAALYDGGYGQHRDTFKAFYWYRKAAKQGQAHSQLMTGMMYLYGSGTPQNSEQAKYWFEQAALSGEPNGQYMYGKILYEESPELALQWYQRAAAQNNGYALYQLSLMHYLGQHPLKNDEVALTMAEKAIRTGHDKAVILKEKLLGRIRNQDFYAPEPKVSINDKIEDNADRKPLIAASATTEPAPVAKTSPEIKSIDRTEVKTDVKPGTISRPIATVDSQPTVQIETDVSNKEKLDTASGKEKQASQPRVETAAEATKQLSTVKSTPPASNKTNKPADKPDSKKQTTASTDDSDWLLAQPKSNYTIQLALMSQYASIKRFGRFYPTVEDTFYYVSEFPKGTLYILLKGSYSSWSEAKAALDALPDKVKKTKPWIRQFEKLQSQYVQPK